MFKVIFLLFLLSYSPLDARKSGGGGGRGGGAARVGNPGGGFQPHPNNNFGGGAQPGGGFHPQPGFNQPGGFHPQQPGGFGGGQPFRPQPGFHGNSQPHFNSGSGPGSISRKAVFTSALAGAALGVGGGLLAYEAGKHIIKAFDRPFNHDNKDYYWDERYYKGNQNEQMCKMPFEQIIAATPTTTTTVATPAADPTLPTTQSSVTTTISPQQALAKAEFPNGSRPKEIVWSCKKNTEICCGTDCCPAPINANVGSSAPSKTSGPGIGSIIFGIFVVLLLLGCCCCLVAYKFCRSAFDSLMPSSTSNNTYYDDSNKYGDYSQGAYGQQPQSYPMQGYPPQQQQYQQYPAYPQPQQQYPVYPPQQKY